MLHLLACALLSASAVSGTADEIAKSLQAATPEVRLHAVRVARSPGAKRDLFVVDESLPTRIEIAFAFWVLRDGQRTILIDTGFFSPTVNGWRIEDYRHPIDGLRQLGIAPKQVTDVVITHSHWDHIGGLWLYENARWWLTEPTLRQLESRGTKSAPKLKSGLKRATEQGRLRVVRAPQKVTPYLAAVPAGLHTRGFMYALMARSDGTWVIASDVGPLRASFEKLSPSGQTSDPKATRRLLSHMMQLAGGELRRIVPGHEPGLFRQSDIAELQVELKVDIDDSAAEQLRALGYVDSAPTDNPESRGVTRHEPAAYDGLNVYTSRREPTAHLMAMDGKILHTWADTRKRAWMHVELQPNGSLFALAKDHYLVKVDWNSKVLWRHATRAHHDMAFDPSGRIYVLSRDAARHAFDGKDLPVLADKIVVLTPNGKAERSIALLPLLADMIPRSRLDKLKRAVAKGTPAKKLAFPEAVGDLTHTNSIEIMARAIPGIAPVGSILLSVREINRIVILDPKAERVLWSWGKGELQEQHHASLLDNGNILVFDNGTRRKRSRVIEVNPATGKITWSYEAPDFFSRLRGGADKLPNGNVLTTESDSGHVREVTPDGKIVWEFWNPNVRGKKNPKRDAIYRFSRVPRSFVLRLSQ